MSYAEDHEALERARGYFDRAERLFAAGHGEASDKERFRGWALLRGVLGRHPWRPRRLRLGVPPRERKVRRGGPDDGGDSARLAPAGGRAPEEPAG